MKRPFSPLVWLCAAGTLALGALTVCDPGGVYAAYVSELSADTPVIAAVFTAAQDGVYPWSFLRAPEAAEPIPAPVYHSLTETVTDEEMRSSVGNNEPFSESGAHDAPEAAQPAAQAEPEASAADGSEESAATVEGFVTVDESWFDDAVFIGDSHIEGFCDYAGVRNATYYYKRGLDIWSVLKKPFVGGKLTVPQALSQQRFGKIYIMLGINEIGCGTTESYAAQYADVVAQLRELQPDALIYIQAIFHTSQKKSDTTIYNNDTINARNEAISRLADGERVFFLDCNAVFDDENGALTPTYSGDGVHVKAPYYTMWRDYLLRFGRGPVAVDDASAGAAPLPAVEAPAPAATTAPAVRPAASAVKPTPVEEVPIPPEAAAAPAEEAPVAEIPSPEADTAAPAEEVEAPAAETGTTAEDAAPAEEPPVEDDGAPVEEQPAENVGAPVESAAESAEETPAAEIGTSVENLAAPAEEYPAEGSAADEAAAESLPEA